VASKDNLQAKTNMAMASLKAGIGLSNASLGAVHAISHQIGGLFDKPHGMVNAILLPHVVEYNLISDNERYAHIAAAMGERVEGVNSRDAAQLAVTAVRNLANDIGIPSRLCDVCVTSQGEIDALVEHALKDVCLVTNPRDLDADNVEELLRAVLPAGAGVSAHPTDIPAFSRLERARAAL
jgi:alcohol dehydrogenase class IV